MYRSGDRVVYSFYNQDNNAVFFDEKKRSFSDFGNMDTDTYQRYMGFFFNVSIYLSNTVST